MSKINRNSVIPLYYQLSEILRKNIKSGKYKGSQLLPSERELCDNFSLSRATVRQAIDLLREEGLIEKVRGKGTRILGEKKYEQDLLGFYNFDLQMGEKGLEASVKLLNAEKEIPSKRIKEALNIENGSKIIKIERLRFVGDSALFIEKLYLPEKMCKNANDEVFSSTNIFSDFLTKKCKMKLGEVKIYIEPILLDDHECKILDISRKPAASLLFERISYDNKSRPILVTKRIFRGDRCRHLITLNPK